MPIPCRISVVALAVLGLASFASGAPVVTTTTSLNIGGSGFDAIDFYYASTPGAEFTNYRLDFETMNGASIYDPVPRDRQNVGGESIDTFMNTVGSVLGLSDATHIQNTYKPTIGGEVSPISKIDWSVFDTFRGDTNDIAGSTGGPFHLARVLLSPDAQWKATFAAFDTLSNAVATTYRFSYNSEPELVEPIVAPPSVITEPVVPPVVPPNPQPIQVPPAAEIIPPVNADPPVLVVDPQPQTSELIDLFETPFQWPIVWSTWTVFIEDGQQLELSDPLNYYPLDHDGFGVTGEGISVWPVFDPIDAVIAFAGDGPTVLNSSINYDLAQGGSNGFHTTAVAGLIAAKRANIAALLHFNAAAATVEATPAPEPAAAALAFAAFAVAVGFTHRRRK